MILRKYQFAFYVVFIAAGAVIVYGNARRWRGLVDPPVNIYNSQSLMRKLLGRSGLIVWNYLIGASFVAFGIVSMLRM
jgi:hypothetical protein